MNQRVCLLAFQGCPNAAQARRVLKEAFHRIALEPLWDEVDLNSSECPAERRGFPSPTILVDGADVSSGRTTFPGMPSCRVGEAPGVEAVVSKLQSAASPSRITRRRGASASGRLVVLLGMSVLISGLNGCGRQAPPAATQETNMKIVVIPVEGMSCVACAARIKKTLTAIDGVGEAEVNLGERRARVRFDPSRLSPERLAAAINALGYHAGAPAEAKQ